VKKRFATSAALVAALSMVGMPTVFAQDDAAAEEPAAEEEGPLFPSMEHFGAVNAAEPVAGKTLEEWAHEMVLWMNAPIDQNALETGDCNIGQGDEVFFLQNTWLGQSIIMECNIPAGAHILAFPGGGFGFNTEPDETPEGLAAFGRQMSQFYNDPKIIVDGTSVPVGPAAWVNAEPFDYEVPENNIFGGYPAGTVTAHYAGWFVMLEPLEPGEHIVIIGDDSIGPVKDVEGNVHYTEGTAYAVYDITVVDGEGDMAEDAAASE